ncbi:Amidohydrolase [Novosphingobium mathurense]|uniref:Amidohydrolase n=2 Tax=Novosphingobium mathurense TaxID=428990 RepID=A0A1U6ILX2_9SPHN|nr:Amidohydrolase [Novosphingobium mathurense]
MQMLTSDLFDRFPTLRFVIPHGGGAIPYHWGRYRGIAQDMGRDIDELLSNVFFDTCVYHSNGLEMLLKTIPSKNILFASEMLGAVRGVNPDTGHYYDDTKYYFDELDMLDPKDAQLIFEDNVRAIYPRLNAHLDALT